MDAITLTVELRPGVVAVLAGYGNVAMSEADESGSCQITIVLRPKGLRRLRGWQPGEVDNPDENDQNSH